MSEPLVVTVELNTRLAAAVIAACRLARFVIGDERALRIAQWAGLRLTRWRCSGHRRWQWLGPIERS